MRGPYERLKYDLRRLWECPLCHKHERTPGTVTSRFCSCAAKQDGGQPAPMQLIADGPQRLVPVIVGRVSDYGSEPVAPLAEPTPLPESPAVELPANELPTDEPPVSES